MHSCNTCSKSITKNSSLFEQHSFMKETERRRPSNIYVDANQRQTRDNETFLHAIFTEISVPSWSWAEKTLRNEFCGCVRQTLDTTVCSLTRVKEHYSSSTQFRIASVLNCLQALGQEWHIILKCCQLFFKQNGLIPIISRMKRNFQQKMDLAMDT